MNEKEKNKKILIKKLGEKECYLCKQLGHIKKDCPNKEKASRLFSNRVNNVDELPDDEGEVEEGEESGEKAKNITAEKSQSNNNEDTVTIASIVKEINGNSQNDAWNDEFPKEDENKKRKKDASLNSSSSSTDSPNITKKTKEGDQNISLEESRDEL